MGLPGVGDRVIHQDDGANNAASGLALALGEVGRITDDVLGLGHFLPVSNAFRHALSWEEVGGWVGGGGGGGLNELL